MGQNTYSTLDGEVAKYVAQGVDKEMGEELGK